MFSFYSNSMTQNIAQARTEREDASIRSLREAFGELEPTRCEHDMAKPRDQHHLACPGHRLEEHHIFENCPRGRRRYQENAPEQPQSIDAVG